MSGSCARGRVDFHAALARIDSIALRTYLEALEAPCHESDLHRTVFPDRDPLRSDALTLYRNHFLLFHTLYRLQDDYYGEEKYLHVHFMRIFLLAYPPPGRCREYDPHAGRFCRTPCPEASFYCDFHRARVGVESLEPLSIKHFYLDAANYDYLDAETAEVFLRGAFEMVADHRRLQESLDILDLPRTADLAMLKRKFRRLAMEHHPDRGAASHERFNRINRAYRILLRLLSMGVPAGQSEKEGRD